MSKILHENQEEVQVESWDNGVEVYRHKHPSWMNEQDAKKYGIGQAVGRWQFLHRKGEIEISLIELKMGFPTDKTWEIYQNKGTPQLFEDVERFESKREAQQRIYELMEDDA